MSAAWNWLTTIFGRRAGAGPNGRRSPRGGRSPGPVSRPARLPAGAMDLAALPLDYPPPMRAPAEPDAFPEWRAALDRVLADQRDALPPFPAVASRVNALLRQPTVDLNLVVAALQQDPALAAQVLTVANSGFFAGHGEVAGVRDAVLRLGLREIGQVVTTAAVVALLDPGHRATAERFPGLWSRLTRHAITSGFAAGGLALARAPEAYETAFMAGLLHDVGRVVALRAVTSMLPPRATGPHGPGHLVESLLEAAHVDCAVRAFETWHLPAAVGEACLHHHAPAAGLVGAAPAVHFVRLASGLDELRTNPHARAGLELEVADSLRALGLTADELWPLHHEVHAFSERAARIVAGLTGGTPPQHQPRAA
jgi:HD-like signal output (HDOD) protein